jgi:hypothetical protein
MAAPVNSVLPVITGTVTVGSTLTVDNGTWDSVDSYAYAWLRDGVAISAETTNSYTLQVDDVTANIVGRVTATNVDGSTIADSAPTVDVPSTLIVETGLEVTNADCYITLANANIYHAKYGNTSWASLAAGAKESSLRKATAFMVQAYRQQWKGYRKTATQSLDWPRSFVFLEPFVHGAVGAYPFLVSDVIVPTEVQNACAELALKASTETLNPDATQSVKKETVGPLTVEYNQYSSQKKQYDSINSMLLPYLSSLGGVSVQLVK